MRVLYIDSFAGISGDMILGAFLDLGIEEDYLEKELKKLNIEDEYEISLRDVKKNGIRGKKIDFILDNHDHSHCNNHGHDHNHSHDRNLKDIEELINRSALEESVKDLSKKIFSYVAEAEAKIHYMPIDEVHFHEVGATDSILDIVGTAICINKLGVDRIIGSPVHTGRGFVNCQHGLIPVPVPATLEILRRAEIPYYSRGIERELVTPTGAAILAGLVDEYGPMPAMEAEEVGYGAGSRDLEIPNMLRLILGKKK